MLILGTRFFMFDHFTCSYFESFLSHSKTTSRKNSSQVHTNMLPSYPSINQNIYCPKCRFPFMWVSQEINRHLFLRRYFGLPKYIKQNIFNKVMLIFEAGKLLTMNHVFFKYIQICLTTNRAEPHQ